MKRLRTLWASNKPTLNGWLSLNSSFGAEIMAKAGFDSLTIDMQHGISTHDCLLPMLQAIGQALPVFVRARSSEPSSIMRLLDLGANGIICPMVNSKQDAQDLVRACYYPPYGERSFGPIRAKFLHEDYFKVAREEVFVFAMIETKKALKEADEILGVDGIDGVYIGPADLSCSFGIEPKFDQEDPKVLQAIEEILGLAKAHHKICGIHNSSVAYAKRMAHLGFDFLTLGSDAIFMLEGARQVVRDFDLREHVGAKAQKMEGD